jgi:hypothetical protein
MSVGGRFLLPGVRCAAILAALLSAVSLPGRAQNVMPLAESGISLNGSDLAVLELGEPRKDLPCGVVPVKPLIGFDLRFHSGYEVSVPMRELAGSDNQLTILFRVVPESHKDSPTYFVQKIKVPTLPEDARGDATLQGSFDLGEGKYKVDWLMRDRSERVCSSSWEAEAALSSKDKPLQLTITPNEVVASAKEEFTEEPPTDRGNSEPALNVKVLVNFAPQNSTAASLQPMDTSALVSILRCLSRDPRIGKFSVVAFNLQEQRVLFRQESQDQIDFPAMGEAVRKLQLGRVDIQRLAQKNSETEFLSHLIQDEFKTADHPDGMIFAGPKSLMNENVPTDMLRTVGEPDYPVFYMNYNLSPQAAPWRDAIGGAVKYFKGQEYTISRPRDLWFAVSDVVSKIVRSKVGKRSVTTASN